MFKVGSQKYEKNDKKKFTFILAFSQIWGFFFCESMALGLNTQLTT